MKKDSFYRMCSTIYNGERVYFKEWITGYTQVVNGVVLHAYLSEKYKCVIEHYTGMAIGYFYCSFKNAFEEAFIRLKDVCNSRQITYEKFLSNYKFLDEVRLTNMDVFLGGDGND